MLCAYLAYHISEYKSHNEFRVASYQCLPHNLACKGYKATIQWECVMPILRYLLIMLSLVLSKYELLCILSRCPNKAKPSSAEISSLLVCGVEGGRVGHNHIHLELTDPAGASSAAGICTSGSVLSVRQNHLSLIISAWRWFKLDLMSSWIIKTVWSVLLNVGSDPDNICFTFVDDLMAVFQCYACCNDWRMMNEFQWHHGDDCQWEY